ncbi:selenium-dependent molybdenum cofactor biosynthesis protein YqeB [Levilinea saccharolytica]|uniref:selenium-dependent molybdenum cofactor biosynthesis protein YqeB n=1 Tax=Levilinea saccharolytica TaxID=229921 RepID=UPI00191C3D3A|nr:selenium-dependent molybdenum cofactor biosynthesis protein YqeB [Levilinea saccharolytica]GAP18069.1 selenium-dependent molybdenum hydroxylase system protein, YqeB family [Levilinea saccharolytica]
MSIKVLIRGGGDLASGIALRLYRAGARVLVTELSAPVMVRRLVSFGQAVYQKNIDVEGVSGQLIHAVDEAEVVHQQGDVAVLVDPDLTCLSAYQPDVLVDCRMLKRPPETGLDAAALVIGIGPGFTAGQDCHAVVETNRGHCMGRVYWQGQAQNDTRIPEAVLNHEADRVLRSPADGEIEVIPAIGSVIQKGELIARVAGHEVTAPWFGVLRGILMSGLPVEAGMKIGDLDPRGEPRYCYMVSDKSLAVGGGVLEAILSRPALRAKIA